MPGKGTVSHTGKLGDVVQESVQASRSFVRSRMLLFGVKPPEFDKKDIHVHVPVGAPPKDGPSAGVAMLSSFFSALTGLTVPHDVALTGQNNLRGGVRRLGVSHEG